MEADISAYDTAYLQARTYAQAPLVTLGLRVESLSVDDIARLDELLARYETMDFADATLVLVAEKTGITTIFTIDRRDFEAYRLRSGRRFRLLMA